MKKLLPLLVLLFTTVYASTTALPTLVPQSESLKDFNNIYYIDNRSSINAVAISEDGKIIVSGSDDNSLKIWDRGTGELIRRLEGHIGDFMEKLQFSLKVLTSKNNNILFFMISKI